MNKPRHEKQRRNRKLIN